MTQNTRLVYSTDPKDNQVCPRCKKLQRECRCPSANEPIGAAFTVIFRLEKGGRGGKTVTVLDGLPKNETFLKELTKELKSRCGTGGTYLLEGKSGIIEIQGDKRDAIKKILDAKKIRFKGM